MNTIQRLLLTALLTVPQLAAANIVISEIDLNNSRVELVNLGETTVDLTSYRWCNFVNGSPRYPGVLATTINATLSSDNDLEMTAGQILTFDLSTALLPAAGGELGLYLPTGGFGSRAALVDYVNWGNSTGFRDDAAIQAPAIWVTNTAIDVSGMGAGDTIQLNLEAPGDAVADYSIAPGTIGTAQSVPSEPEVAGRITKVGFVDASTMFVEYEFTGAGSMKLTESSDLNSFSQVATRTTVSSPSQNRLEFAIPSSANRMYFRIEEG